MKLFNSILKVKPKQSIHQPKTANDLLGNEVEGTEISSDLQKNEARYNHLFNKNFDFLLKQIHIGGQEGIILYLKSMVDESKVSEQIMERLAHTQGQKNTISSNQQLLSFKKDYFASADVVILEYDHDVIWHVLLGYTIILISGINSGLAINTVSSEQRAIEQSNTQTIIRGPKDSFTESITTNVSLIRRRIKNPKLICENIIIGQDTKTSVCITYLDYLASGEIVEEIRKRIQDLKINGIFDSGNLEELINDQVVTPFPTIYHTDRPDTIAQSLIEGKIAVIVDGTPFVLVMPVVITDFFKVSEDYYQGFLISSFVRMIRYLAFSLSWVLPSLYIGLTTFHHELIPTALVFKIQAQREGVPFPAVIEILTMEVTFEILREAGVRMPRAVGQAVSIVGTLVIGQAAVEAGLVSNLLVIIVALTAIASFVSPIYSFGNASRLLRFGLLILTAALGLYGMIVGIILVITHLASLRSFGIPYLAPLGPFIMEDQKDVFVRFPMQTLKKRPHYLNNRNIAEMSVDSSQDGGKS
ncbi:spore germination protein [Anaerobacillus alkalidiazotrophicus]|uniref:Spore germination protein n=1 Tax=Anaerobacillus alkalidiazotrophicus TaxID=472963 RepID=A0A1S2M8G5_9BACI|nr:spore germination protein [Anaerobacillus alkalidiazotrophicus]OIJ20810.1 spore germination protein [Anaerobacillus alkalidiazotrophicus]